MSLVALAIPLGHRGGPPPLCGNALPGSLRSTLPDSMCRRLSAASISQPQVFRRQGSLPPSQCMQDAAAFGMPAMQLQRQVSLPYSAPPSLHQSPLPSPMATPRGTMLEFDDLHFDGLLFNPSQPQLKALLLQKMRMQPTAHLEPMSGGIGSCNSGLWLLRDGTKSFVLKLVRSNPSFGGPPQASEAEKFAKLYNEIPGIASDPSLSFPCKVFRCIGQTGTKTHDLVVMRQALGLRVSEFIMQKLHAKQVQELMYALEQFGGFLADFHARYNGMQHGDLTPANVFFDQLTGKFTLVDVADLAPRNPVIQSDTDRFASSLKLLSHFYGPQLFMEGKARFEAGYAARRSSMPLRAA